MACPVDHEELSISARPARQSAGLSVGINEDLIKRLVHSFYDRVRRDEMLGPIFDRHVDDWDLHLDKLCAFWSSVALTTGRYKGTPMQVHVALSQEEQGDFTSDHFAHWLVLFGKTADDICDEPAAALFKDRANRIASSLQMAINLDQGKLLG